jgi:hypothetical protein
MTTMITIRTTMRLHPPVSRFLPRSHRLRHAALQRSRILATHRLRIKPRFRRGEDHPRLRHRIAHLHGSRWMFTGNLHRADDLWT